MIKILRLPIFVLLGLFITQKTYAQFPYIESFRNATAPGITFGGAPSAFLTAGGNAYNTTTATHTGTPIDPNGNGYLRLTNSGINQKGYAISTANFPSSNGLSVMFEYYIYGGTGADGISFFLFDATASPFQIGGFGGSLGYAQITTTTPTSQGVSKGYLAIGLDEYGNFSNPIEGRQGGIAGLRPGSVTLRGKGDGDATVPSNYAFLSTARMADFGFPLVGDAGGRQPDSTNTGYRKVFMDLAPNPNGGFNITVRVTKGGSPTTSATVIDNYYYPEASPANLRYGFASSTGDQTNFHEIRNVTIDAYNADGLTNPVAANDLLTICQGKQAVIDVAANDKTTNAGATILKASIDLDPNTVGIQNTFTVAGKGTFSLNSEGSIQFVPEAALLGNVSCFYNIKDSFGKTSNSAAITLTYVTPPAQPNAGTDQLINITTPTATYTLDGSSTGLNAGKWTQVSGPGIATITNPAVYNTTVTNLLGGTYVFRWSVTSAGGCELTDDVQLIVNHRPVAVDDAITTNLNTNIPIPVLDNDTDADGNSTIDKATIIIKSQPLHGTLIVDPVTGIVTYRPYDGYSGYDSFVYTVKDVYGVESNTAIVTIAVNIKPIGVADTTSTISGTPVGIHVLDNDPGKTGATVIKNSDPLNGTIIINADGTVTYTPNPGFSGKDTFTYRIRNKDGLESDPITVTVNVKPQGSADTSTTPAGTAVIIPVKDNDINKTGTTVVLNTNPLNGTVTLNAAGNVVYTPNPGFSGKDTFTYVLHTVDGLDSDPITVTVNVKPVGAIDAVNTPPNTPITIPVKNNDISKTGTTVILNTNPGHGTVTIDAAGNAIYTPVTGYTGKDTFTYFLRTADGLDSDPITVNVTVKPVGSADVASIPVNVPVTISVKDNDLSKTGTTVVVNTNPANGTVTVDANGNVIYTPKAGYTGTDTFTYILRTADGLDSDPILVTVTIKAPVVAPNITIGTNVNSPITINVPIPTGGSVIITVPPAHGTITFDPVTGLPIYTPTPGYSGPDDFTYVIKDPDGSLSSPGKVTITVTIPAKIGVAKKLKTTVKNADGSFTLTYVFTLVNYGDVAMNKVSLTDDLANIFSGNTIKVNRLNASGSLIVNSAYNGGTVKEMLSVTSTLAKQSKETVELEINVSLDKTEGTFYNSAVAKGTSTSDGTETFDVSTDGYNPDPFTVGDPSPSEFTPVKLIKQDIFIPGGFSPNNDGINDFFVIENAAGKQISLDVYNRWGNLIHRSKSYQNDWAGKTTQGIHINDDVPTGTYYYIVMIDGKDKRVGYITINR